MIRWKVVDAERKSAIVKGKYQLHYERGKIIEAPENTLGIFCFKRKKDAKIFCFLFREKKFQILRVLPLSRGKTPEGICPLSDVESLDRFYRSHSKAFQSFRPNGTICYKEIKVLD